MHSRLLTQVFGFFAVLALPLILASCSQGYPGYAVVLWSPDEQKIATGVSVAAMAHSQLRRTVQVMLIDEKEKVSGDPISVEQWRLKEFPNFREMTDWKTANKDYLSLFIRSKKLALPVRGDPAIRDGNIIYRMREQEDAKVLSRQENESNAGGLKGYWYEIMTQTGTMGWVFSAQIEPWRLGDIRASRAQAQEDQLERLYKGNWRPEEFELMIRTGAYDLAFFKPTTGLMLDRDQKTVHLATEKEVIDFSFKSVDRIGRDIWSLTGTPIQATFKDEKTIVVQYQKGNNAYTRIFMDLDQDIAELYQAEVNRRSDLLSRFSGTNGTIASGNYGSISIDSNGNFSWDGVDALKPRIVPDAAQNSGNITFDLFLAPELKASYAGVASFNFSTADGIAQVNFLYQWKPDGVQLEYVPNSLVKGREVKKADSNPTVLFFGY